MAITYVGFNGGDGTGAVTVGAVSGVAHDDLLILTIEGEGEDTSADSPPTGGAWTAIDGSTGSVASATDGATDRTRNSTYYAWYDSGSPPNQQVPDAGNHTVAVITAWRGVDPDAPIHLAGSSSSSTNDTSVSVTSAGSTTVDDCMIVVTTTAGDNNNLPYPGGSAYYSSWSNANLASITEAVDVGSNAGSDGAIGVAYGILASAGPIGTTTATISLSEEEANWCIALKPKPATSTVEQSHYRIYSDGTESGSTAFGALDRGKALEAGTTYHVRFELKNTVASGSVKPKLQYRKRTTVAGGFGSWTDVTGSSTDVQAVASASLTDDAVTTERLAGTGTFVAGRIDEGDGSITTAVSVAAGEDTEFLFSIKLIDGDIASWRNGLELRLIDITTGVYNTYTMNPQLSKWGSISEDMEGGTDTSQVTTVNTNFDAAPSHADMVFDSTPARGSLSTLAVGTVGVTAGWDDILCPEMFYRTYLYVAATPATTSTFMRWSYTTGGTFNSALRWSTSDTIMIGETDGTYTALTGTPSKNQWIRVELLVQLDNAGTDTGIMEGKFWNTADSSGTPDGTLVLDPAKALTSFEDVWAIRAEGSASNIYNFDEVSISNVDWIGPSDATHDTSDNRGLTDTSSRVAVYVRDYSDGRGLTDAGKRIDFVGDVTGEERGLTDSLTYAVGSPATITPAAVAGVAAIDAPTVTHSATVTPTAVVGTAFVDSPTVTSAATIAATAVAGLAAIDAPTVTHSATVTPTAVAGSSWIDPVDGYFVLDGTSGNYASVPDHADFRFTADIDLMVRLSAAWSPSTQVQLLNTWNATGSTGVLFRINTDVMYLNYVTNPGVPIGRQATCTAAPTTVSADDTLTWWRVTRVNSTGDIKFWYSLDVTNDHAAVSWTQLGSTVTQHSGENLIAGTTDLVLGSATPYTGTFAAENLYAAAAEKDGTLVFDADFTDLTVAEELAGSFVEDSSGGHTVTLNGSAWVYGRSVTASATITPTAVAGAASVPTVTVTSSATVTPTAVVGAASVDAPTVTSAATITATSVLSVAAVPNPTVTSAATIAAAAVVALAFIDNPTVTHTATITAAAVAGVAFVDAPTVVVGSSATVTPASVVGLAFVPDPTVTHSATITATAVLGTAFVPDPTVTHSATITATAVLGTAFVDDPTVVTASDATITPTAIVGTAFIDAPTVVAESSATITATAVAGTSFIPTQAVTSSVSISATAVVGTAFIPSETITSAATIIPTAVVATGTIDLPEVTAGVTASPVAVAATTTIPPPTITATALITAAAVVGVAAIDSPVVTHGASIAPSSVSGTATIDAPVVTSHATITPTAIAGSAFIPAPTVTHSATITVTAVTGLAAIDSPTVTHSTAITPTAIVGTITIPVPTVYEIRRLDAAGNISVAGWTANGASSVWEAVKLDDAAYAEYL